MMMKMMMMMMMIIGEKSIMRMAFNVEAVCKALKHVSVHMHKPCTAEIKSGATWIHQPLLMLRMLPSQRKKGTTEAYPHRCGHIGNAAIDTRAATQSLSIYCVWDLLRLVGTVRRKAIF
eukprot:8545151-Karenia_brevis.AAC.1